MAALHGGASAHKLSTPYAVIWPSSGWSSQRGRLMLGGWLRVVFNRENALVAPRWRGCQLDQIICRRRATPFRIVPFGLPLRLQYSSARAAVMPGFDANHSNSQPIVNSR